MVEFSLDTAKFLLDFAIQAYKNENDRIIPHGLELIKSISDKKTDTQCYIAKDEQRAVVAFRGTSSFEDVLTDLSIIQQNFPPTRRPIFKPKAHSGFLNAYDSINLELKAEVLKLLNLNNNYTFYVTGHSLGGALATLLAIDLKRTFKNINVIIYTYGSPRVGNKWFVRMFNNSLKNQSYRIVNERDFIPQVPGGSYRHVAIYTLLDDKGKIILHPNVLEKIGKTIEGIESLLSLDISEEHAHTYYKKLLDQVTEIV